MRRSRLALSVLAPLGLVAHAFAAGLTPQDLVMLNRLSDPQVSPDGSQVAYVLRTTDLAANRGSNDIWLLDLTTAGATPRQVTSHSAQDTNPRWSADGRTLYFLSSRSGSRQVWRLPVAGGEALQVTDLPVPVNELMVSPAGDRLLVSVEAQADCADLACTAQFLEKRGKETASGLVFDQLFVRHWDRWENDTYAHLVSLRIGTDGKAGTPVDLMRGMRANTPARPLGDDREFTFSPDGRRVVFSARMADRGEPWSTNMDLYEVSVDGGTPANLTADNQAWDTQPRFLADGTLVWLAMSRPGFEADRFRVLMRDAQGNGQRGAARELTTGWTLSVDTLTVARDGRTLLLTADESGQVPLYRLDPRKPGKPLVLHFAGQVTAFSDSPRGPVLALASLDAPADLFRLEAAGKEPRRLTAVNGALLDAREHLDVERFSFPGAAGATVYGHVVKPAGYVAGQKYPIAFIVHGGPQVAFGNAWSYRWNPKTFAGAGYAVVFIDFHGTPGYGQDFTDSISGDWGGKPLEDLKSGFAAALAKYPFLDGSRACALGASYGGYMMNWIAGNWSDQFRCIVNHAGIFDSRAMYYTNEELWFEEWDHGGAPYFDRPETYEKFNPANFVKNWRTPMLVIHGQLDYRVPYSQGIAAFTALQRRGIESRLVVFPDENHWISKPANSLQWHREVLGWLDAHLKAAK
jgi:dipeptidyl aminopeptidase/acylaminoacyl peptidase